MGKQNIGSIVHVTYIKIMVGRELFENELLQIDHTFSHGRKVLPVLVYLS